MMSLLSRTVFRNALTNIRPFQLGVRTVAYRFVNFPISSKYYHVPMPNRVQPAIQLIKSENNLNEKCFLLEHLVELIQKDPKLMLS